jgi:hypothetical protein
MVVVPHVLEHGLHDLPRMTSEQSRRRFPSQVVQTISSRQLLLMAARWSQGTPKLLEFKGTFQVVHNQPQERFRNSQ